MFKIVVTPPEDETSECVNVPPRRPRMTRMGTPMPRPMPMPMPMPQPASSSDAVEELRALGVSDRVIQMATHATSAVRAAPAAPRIVHTARPKFDAPTAASCKVIAPCARRASQSQSEANGDEHTADTDSAHLSTSSDSGSDDESDSHAAAHIHHRPMSHTDALSGPDGVRIPSAFFRGTFLDSSGHLLPPIANPDLGPSLARADSFFVGPEEERPVGCRTHKEMWEGRTPEREVACLAESDNSTVNTSPTSQLTPAHAAIAASKTKSVYAQALQPHPSDSTASTSSSVGRDGLLGEDEWSSVIDATVFVARHEFNQVEKQRQRASTSPIDNDDTGVAELKESDGLSIELIEHEHEHEPDHGRTTATSAAASDSSHPSSLSERGVVQGAASCSAESTQSHADKHDDAHHQPD